MPATELPLLVLAGPTASGKSGLAMAVAEHLPVEIVSADSAQVYRGMDIGTAKPSAPERAAVPHHLIDLVDPAEPYSAARFAADAAGVIAGIRSRGRLPLVVGGTLLYLRALLDGLSPLPSADVGVRERLVERLRREGSPALHGVLAQQDPETAARLHPNDAQRILRALEIGQLSGQPASQLQAVVPVPAVTGPVLRFALFWPDRADLHARIARRFADMMAAGLLDEVRMLYRRGDLHAELPAIRSVGYRQLWRHLEGGCDLDTAVAQSVAATRQLAKRQMTWLRGEASRWQALPAAEGTRVAVAALLAHPALNDSRLS